MNSMLLASGGGGDFSLVSYEGKGDTTLDKISSIPDMAPLVGEDNQRQLPKSNAPKAAFRTARCRQLFSVPRKAHIRGWGSIAGWDQSSFGDTNIDHVKVTVSGFLKMTVHFIVRSFFFDEWDSLVME